MASLPRRWIVYDRHSSFILVNTIKTGAGCSDRYRPEIPAHDARLRRRDQLSATVDPPPRQTACGSFPLRMVIGRSRGEYPGAGILRKTCRRSSKAAECGSPRWRSPSMVMVGNGDECGTCRRTSLSNRHKRAFAVGGPIRPR